MVRDDVVRPQDQDHPGELDLRDRLRRVEVAVRLVDRIEVEGQAIRPLHDAGQHLGAVEVRDEHEVDVHAPEDLVERLDVRRLDVDPGEHHRIRELGVEAGQVERAHRAIRRVEADPVKHETGRGGQRSERVLERRHRGASLPPPGRPSQGTRGAGVRVLHAPCRRLLPLSARREDLSGARGCESALEPGSCGAARRRRSMP